MDKLRGCMFSLYNRTINKIIPVEGYFHKWGSEAIEGKDQSVATNTIAVVEDKEGQVHIVSADAVKFTEFIF